MKFSGPKLVISRSFPLAFTHLVAVSRSSLISTLRTIFASHESDMRYQNPSAQQRIAPLYFPLLLTVIDDSTIITAQDMKEGEKEEWLICVLYVLRSVPPPITIVFILVLTLNIDLETFLWRRCERGSR